MYYAQWIISCFIPRTVSTLVTQSIASLKQSYSKLDRSPFVSTRYCTSGYMSCIVAVSGSSQPRSIQDRQSSHLCQPKTIMNIPWVVLFHFLSMIGNSRCMSLQRDHSNYRRMWHSYQKRAMCRIFPLLLIQCRSLQDRCFRRFCTPPPVLCF